MVYIYKKKSGLKIYYYLRASERKDGKVLVKDIAYLGSSLEEVKKSLKDKKYYSEIRKAYKTIHSFLESNKYVESIIKRKYIDELLVFVRGELEKVEAKEVKKEEMKK